MAKIMLVEDDNNLREIYGARLLAEGHEIVTAKDGEEALATAVKEKPDLIISDVMMPRISGFDMLDILRNAPETKYTKVIMMTALSQAEDKARADNLGADRYLVKSQVTLEDVARVVRDVLDGKTDGETVATARVNAEASTLVSAAAASPAQPETPPAPGPPTTPIEPQPVIATPEVVPVSEPQPAVAAASPSAPADDSIAITPAPAGSTSAVQPAADQSTPSLDPQAADSPAADPVQPIVQPTEHVEAAEPGADETPLVVPELNTLLESPIAETGAPAPQQAESATPQASATPAAPVINVELPNLESTEEPQAEPAAPETVRTTTEEAAGTFVGPSLVEALEQEAAEAGSTSENSALATNPNTVIASDALQTEAIAAPDTGSIVLPEPETVTEPAAASSAPELPAVQPQQAEPPASTGQIPASEPAVPVPAASQEQPAESDQSNSSNPLVDESRKKVVIQPIHDISKGPDLNALLEKENRNAPVLNPGTSTVITPKPGQDVTAPPQPATGDAPVQQPSSANEHDIIAL